MSSNDRRAPRQGSNNLRQVEILRVAEGGDVFLRMLSPAYGGLFYHWIKGKGEYCRKQTCPPANHKEKLLWRGYAAVELYNLSANTWDPWVLEITPALELDFRDVYRRGQVWNLRREIQTGKGKTPIIGHLHETLDTSAIPLQFDYMPVLVAVYGVMPLDLSAKNPLPPRVILAASTGAPPSGLVVGKEEETLSPEELADFRERMNLQKKSSSGHNGNGRKPGVKYY